MTFGCINAALKMRQYWLFTSPSLEVWTCDCDTGNKITIKSLCNCSLYDHITFDNLPAGLCLVNVLPISLGARCVEGVRKSWVRCATGGVLPPRHPDLDLSWKVLLMCGIVDKQGYLGRIENQHFDRLNINLSQLPNAHKSNVNS